MVGDDVVSFSSENIRLMPRTDQIRPIDSISRISAEPAPYLGSEAFFSWSAMRLEPLMPRAFLSAPLV